MDVVANLAHRSYALFVYVVAKDTVRAWVPPKAETDVLQAQGYAGVTAIARGTDGGVGKVPRLGWP